MHTLSRCLCHRCKVSASVTPLYLNEVNGYYFCADCEDDLKEEYALTYEDDTGEPDELTWEGN